MSREQLLTLHHQPTTLEQLARRMNDPQLGLHLFLTEQLGFHPETRMPLNPSDYEGLFIDQCRFANNFPKPQLSQGFRDLEPLATAAFADPTTLRAYLRSPLLAIPAFPIHIPRFEPPEHVNGRKFKFRERDRLFSESPLFINPTHLFYRYHGPQKGGFQRKGKDVLRCYQEIDTLHLFEPTTLHAALRAIKQADPSATILMIHGAARKLSLESPLTLDPTTLSDIDVTVFSSNQNILLDMVQRLSKKHSSQFRPRGYITAIGNKRTLTMIDSLGTNTSFVEIESSDSPTLSFMKGYAIDDQGDHSHTDNPYLFLSSISNYRGISFVVEFYELDGKSYPVLIPLDLFNGLKSMTLPSGNPITVTHPKRLHPNGPLGVWNILRTYADAAALGTTVDTLSSTLIGLTNNQNLPTAPEDHIPSNNMYVPADLLIEMTGILSWVLAKPNAWTHFSNTQAINFFPILHHLIHTHPDIGQMLIDNDFSQYTHYKSIAPTLLLALAFRDIFIHPDSPYKGKRDLFEHIVEDLISCAFSIINDPEDTEYLRNLLTRKRTHYLGWNEINSRHINVKNLYIPLRLTTLFLFQPHLVSGHRLIFNNGYREVRRKDYGNRFIGDYQQKGHSLLLALNNQWIKSNLSSSN